MKLFKVTCRGMQSDATGRPNGIAYVVAVDAGAAYEGVLKRLETRDLGFYGDRELKSVELVADCSETSNLPALIFGRTE